jgi:hypothetical protein
MQKSLALTFVAAIAALSALPAAAQTTNIPALVLTVPVSVSNLDTEAFKTLSVGCIAHDGNVVMAKGETTIPLVVVPATPSVRSTESFTGNVTVNLVTTAAVGVAYKGGAGKSDPETVAMADTAAAIKAIQKTGSYQCVLETSQKVANLQLLAPLGSVKLADPQIITETVNGQPVKSSRSTVVVEAKVSP